MRWASPVWAQDDYRELICSYFGSECDKAMRVAMCESTMNPRAEAAGNRGLFQVNVIHSAMVGGNVDLLYDPEINTRIAHELYLAQGWGPWFYCGTR